MPTGNRRWRTARRVLSVSLAVISAGCGRSAVRPVAATQSPAAPPSVSRQALAQSSPAPPIPPTLAVPDRSLPVATPPDLAQASPTASTPLLDAALDRAEALQTTVAGEVAKPADRPHVLPVSATRRGTDPTDAPEAPIPELAPSPEPAAAETTAPPPESITALPDFSPAESSKPAPEPTPPPPAEPVPAPAAPSEPSPQAQAAPAPPAPATPDSLSSSAAPLGEGHAEARPETPEEPTEIAGAEALAITTLMPCRRVRGFGDVDAWGAPRVHPGQAFILYSELAGVGYEAAGDRYHSRVTASAELIPDGTTTPAWRETLGLAEETAPSPRRDYFVSYLITIPESLRAGAYHLKVTQVDEVGARTASRSIPLAVGR